MGRLENLFGWGGTFSFNHRSLKNKEDRIRKTFRIVLRRDRLGDLLLLKFGAKATNDIIVQHAVAALEVIIDSGELRGGELLRIKGPSSEPVSFGLGITLGLRVVELYGAIAVYDNQPEMMMFEIVWAREGSTYKRGGTIAEM
jgi:CRISPR-associated protein Csx3